MVMGRRSVYGLSDWSRIHERALNMYGLLRALDVYMVRVLVLVNILRKMSNEFNICRGEWVEWLFFSNPGFVVASHIEWPALVRYEWALRHLHSVAVAAHKWCPLINRYQHSPVTASWNGKINHNNRMNANIQLQTRLEWKMVMFLFYFIPHRLAPVNVAFVPFSVHLGQWRVARSANCPVQYLLAWSVCRQTRKALSVVW